MLASFPAMSTLSPARPVAADSLFKALLKFQRVRQRTVQLCQPLETEDYVMQPMVDVSPPKWHLAHSTWFFETFVLQKFAKSYQPFHPEYGHLFNSYYNHLGDRVLRDERGFMSRPPVRDVLAYREYVDAAVLKLQEEVHESDHLPLTTLL